MGIHLMSPLYKIILTPMADIAVFYPTANGSSQEIDTQYPASGAHWDKVDEPVTDDDATYIAAVTGAVEPLFDSFLHDDFPRALATITKMELHLRVKRTWSNVYLGYIAGRIIVDPTHEYEQEVLVSEAPGDGNWYSVTKTWALNPLTGLAWTVADIDALEFGVRLNKGYAAGSSTYCSQVYMAVYYTFTP